jgi:hypothetical protein
MLPTIRIQRLSLSEHIQVKEKGPLFAGLLLSISSLPICVEFPASLSEMQAVYFHLAMRFGGQFDLT